MSQTEKTYQTLKISVIQSCLLVVTASGAGVSVYSTNKLRASAAIYFKTDLKLYNTFVSANHSEKCIVFPVIASQ